MLELQEVTLHLSEDEESDPILHEIAVRVPVRGHFLAVVGPSGCGKSTLLKVIAGLREPTGGTIRWEGRDLALDGDLLPHEIGYVPQFSIAYDSLTVRESVGIASQLRVSELDRAEREESVQRILDEVGLAEIAERQVVVLSGGQRRRLALALEMVASPHLLLCDEVTSGLDPKAEDEIARLLQRLSRQAERLVVSVTHSLRHLSLCDGVLVLYGGRVVYHGSPEFLLHYFGVEKQEDLFATLGQRTPEKWSVSWTKHRGAYYERSGLNQAEKKRETEADQLPTVLANAPTPQPWEKTPEKSAPSGEPPVPLPLVHTPGLITQWWILLRRRWLLFLRDRGQLWLHLALLLGFPLLVVVFAWDGLPQMKGWAETTGNAYQQFQSEAARQAELMRTGSLVSGLIMFQVILLALMGANNSAREIAAERHIFEKEKFSGLSPLAYVLSKAAFLALLCAVQSVWMAFFVNSIVRFPGSMGDRVLVLFGANAAVTFICLGISALARKAEQASLLSIYLVGFQLPLSGAVLALPAWLSTFTRPLIASYWGWSGFIQTLRDSRFYEAIGSVTQTKLLSEPLCVWVLLCHCLVGLYLAIVGCRQARWE